MARKLPWANTGNAATRTPPRTARPGRTENNAQASIITYASPRSDFKRDTSGSVCAASSSTPRSKGRPDPKQKNYDGHDPLESSPPPSSPPANATGPPPLEPLRPGFDADDIFVMVEDELYDCAKEFTQSLHLEEYRRLRKEAKERKRKAARFASDGDDADEDSISHELKTAKKRKRLEERQMSGLSDILGKNGNRTDDDQEDDDQEDDDQESEVEDVTDLWTGTTLAHLMRFDPSASKTSLKGLENLSRQTRAAKGYRPNSNPFVKGTHTRTEKARSRDGSSKITVSEATSSNRRLCNPKHNDFVAHGSVLTTDRQLNSERPAKDKNVSETSSTSDSTLLRQSRRKPNRFLDALDDFNPANVRISDDTGQVAVRRSAFRSRVSKPTPEIKQEHEINPIDHRKVQRNRADEVPTFLV